MPDALSGVTVIEFGGYAAGPAIGKYLANFGARVIHVESLSRPDGFRLQYPPYKDHKIGIDRSGCFAIFNDSKSGVTLNLKAPSGLALAEQIVGRANVVIENMRPGVMERLQLGADRLREINPALVVLSTSNLGQTGPHAAHPGFGSQLSSLSGFTHLTGAPDGPPQLLYGPYIDFVAVVFGGAAVLAALEQQKRTGRGACIDLSQYEAGLQFLSSPLLDYTANNHVASRWGNMDVEAVPHGCYRSTDDRWCVVSCWDDEEFCRCADALDHPEWKGDPRFSSISSRRENENLLNEAIGNAVARHSATSIMHLLQEHHVHAAVVNTIADLFTDPQLTFRNTWQPHEHSEMGSHHSRMVAYQLSETPGRTRSAAPCLGEHNESVFQDWLGISKEDLATAEKAGAFK